MTLLERLIEKQMELELSDRAFARRRGISRDLWSKTRSGKAPIRFEILAGVMREFPAFAAEVLHYLATVETREQRRRVEYEVDGVGRPTDNQFTSK